MTKAGFGTRFGFYLVAIGSACGLGNLWRFPYVVGENGGGAFIFLYLLLALAVGLPLLIGELLIGKSMKQGILLSSQNFSRQHNQPLFKWIGRVSVALSVLVLSYYAVVSGWVLHFLMQFLLVALGVKAATSQELFSGLMSNGVLQVALASVHVLVVLIVTVRGFQEGVEKRAGQIMALFVILLVVLMLKSLAQDTSVEAVRFLFYPDFSKLKGSSLLDALGHVFFTLSVGFGTMITFGSYLKDTEHVPTAGFKVTVTDTLISLMAVLLIFPLVIGAATTTKLSDPALMFTSLPQFFLRMKGGVIFGLAFFLCLYFAAFGASLGLFEVIVSNLTDRNKNWSRERSSWVTGLVVVLIAVIPSFSGSLFSELKVHGRGLLEILDDILMSWILPIVGIGMAIMVRKALPSEVKNSEFEQTEHINSRSLYGYWKFSLGYGIPTLVLLGFILKLLSFL